MALLPRSSPGVEGVDGPALLDFLRGLRALDAVHSVMVLRHGKVIAEAWARPYAPDVPHMLFSLTKSFTSCAVGLACAEGKLSLDDRLTELFPDKLPSRPDPKFADLRIRHLLSMTSGHDVCPMGEMMKTPDWEQAFFASSLAHEPGAKFCYNSGASYMLASAVARAVGTGVQEYLRPRLLEPLGIVPRRWERSPSGVENGGFGYSLATEEIASFAQCLLDGGKRNGRQLIPADYLARACSKQSDNSMNEPPDWREGYGFQFWRCRHGAWRGDGAFGQFAVAMPAQRMALAVTAGLSIMQEVLDLVWERLLPAAREGVLPASPEDAEDLAGEIDLWAMPVLNSAGRIVLPQRYKVAENGAGFRTLALWATERGVEVTLDDETLRADHGVHHYNRLHWGEPRERRMAASAAWRDDNTLDILVCCYETPFQWRITVALDGDRATVTRVDNRSFGPQRWEVLNAVRGG